MAKIEASSRHLVQVLMLTGLINTALCCQCLIKLIPPSTLSFKLRSISAIKTLWRLHCCAGDTKAWVCVAAVLFPQHKRVRPAVSQSLSLPQSQAEKQVPLDSCERASWWPRPSAPGLYIPTLCTNWRLVCLRPSLYRQAHCTHVFPPSHGGNAQKVVKQNFRMEKLCFRGIIWPSGQLFHITCTVLAGTYVQHKMGIENWSSDWIPWNSFPSQLMIPHLDSLAEVVGCTLRCLIWNEESSWPQDKSTSNCDFTSLVKTTPLRFASFAKLWQHGGYTPNMQKHLLAACYYFATMLHV